MMELESFKEEFSRTPTKREKSSIIDRISEDLNLNKNTPLFIPDIKYETKPCPNCNREDRIREATLISKKDELKEYNYYKYCYNCGKKFDFEYIPFPEDNICKRDEDGKNN